jgi:pilus assembly protein CpaD
MPSMNDTMRITALAAVLLAGSCSSDVGTLSADGERNHPIVVEPSSNSIKLPFSATDAGLLPEDSLRFEAFVDAYQHGGNGAISVSAPAGPASNAAISYFGERLAQMGVPRSRILVGTHDVANGDTSVELDFIGYSAHTDQCGDWSMDLAETSSNETSPNFGCSVQHNIAAMVEDPRDLVEPRDLGPGDATRHAIILEKYEKGDITQATKHKTDAINEQSGASSTQSGGQ